MKSGSNPDLFKGTAFYYSRYRPPYPKLFFEYLNTKFKLNGHGRLLDLGCGTGQLAIPLAKSFDEVIGMDPQKEMLDEAKTVADKEGISNISWISGGSEDLLKLKKIIGKVTLVVIGRAFHWMDQPITLDMLDQLIEEDGSIVIVTDGLGDRSPKNDWQDVVSEIRIKYQLIKKPSTFQNAQSIPRFEDSLKKSKFSQVEIKDFNFQREWDINQIIGYVYSLSASSLVKLADQKNKFEEDLRDTLLELNPDGDFKEEVILEVITAHRPS